MSTQQTEHLLKTAEFSKSPSKAPGQKDKSQSNIPSEVQDTKHYITYFWAAKSVEFGEDISSAVFPTEGPYTNFIGISDLAVIDIMRLIIVKNSRVFASAGTASKDSDGHRVPLNSEKDVGETQPGSFPPEAGRVHSHIGSDQRRNPGSSVRNTQQQHSEDTGPNAGCNNYSNAARPHVPPNARYEAPYYTPPQMLTPSDDGVINNNPPAYRAHQLYSSNAHSLRFSNSSSDYLPSEDDMPGNGYNPPVPQNHSFSYDFRHEFPNSSSNYNPPITSNAPVEGNNRHVNYGQMFPQNFSNPRQRGQFSRGFSQRFPNTGRDFIPSNTAHYRGSNINHNPDANSVYHNLTAPQRYSNTCRPRLLNLQRHPNPMVPPLYKPEEFHMNPRDGSYNAINPEFHRVQYPDPSNELHLSPTVSAGRVYGAFNEQPSTSTPQNYSHGVPGREQRLANYDLTVQHRHRYRPYSTENSIPYRALLSTSGGNIVRSPNIEMSPSGFSRMTSDTLGLRPQSETYGPTPPSTMPNSPFLDPAVPGPSSAESTRLEAELDDAVSCKDAARLALLAARARSVGDGVSAQRAEANAAFLRRDLVAVEKLIEAETFPERYLKEMQTLWYSCQFQREFPTRPIPKNFSMAFKQRNHMPETLRSVVHHILAAAFDQNPFPSPEERELLVERVGYNSKQIENWFKNRRKDLDRETHAPRSGKGGGRRCGKGRGKGRKS